MPGEARPPCRCPEPAAPARLGTKHRGVPPVSGALTPADLRHLCLWVLGGVENHPAIHRGNRDGLMDTVPHQPEEGARILPLCRGRGESEAQRVRALGLAGAGPTPILLCLQPHLQREVLVPPGLVWREQGQERAVCIDFGLLHGQVQGAGAFMCRREQVQSWLPSPEGLVCAWETRGAVSFDLPT